MNADERRCTLDKADAVATAAAVKRGKVTATEAVSAALERIAVKDKAFIVSLLSLHQAHSQQRKI